MARAYLGADPDVHYGRLKKHYSTAAHFIKSAQDKVRDGRCRSALRVLSTAFLAIGALNAEELGMSKMDIIVRRDPRLTRQLRDRIGALNTAAAKLQTKILNACTRE